MGLTGDDHAPGHLANIAFFPFFCPWTVASLVPAIMGFYAIRKNGNAFLGEGGSQKALMWAWIGCSSAILLAFFRLLQYLIGGSWVEIF